MVETVLLPADPPSGPSTADPEAPVQAQLVEAALAGRLSELVDPPDSFCFSAFREFERCPLSYALKYICGLEAPEPVPAFAFGTAAHRAFELFTRERRLREEQGAEPPDRSDLDRSFAEAWSDADFGDEEAKSAWLPRVQPMLEAFWKAEMQRQPSTIAEEAGFRLKLELPDGAAVSLSGIIDRLDRRQDGSLELLDYKTGPAWGPAMRTYALQLAIYAWGCAEALGMEVPRRGLLYFVEHGLFAVKPLGQEVVEATRREVGERATAIRVSDFAPTPSKAACQWCEFRTLCPATSR